MISYNTMDWCIQMHQNSNHYYDKYLPYEFHLRMVVQVFNQFKHLLPSGMYHKTYDRFPNEDITLDVIESACWAHDIIEDTTKSYNDVKECFGEDVAELVYALTNEKGRNRSERANRKYYEGIKNTPGAIFVKLCDRIANVQYSKMTKSRMFETYKAENPKFISSLACSDLENYVEMVEYLQNLFI